MYSLSQRSTPGSHDHYSFSADGVLDFPPGTGIKPLFLTQTFGGVVCTLVTRMSTYSPPHLGDPTRVRAPRGQQVSVSATQLQCATGRDQEGDANAHDTHIRLESDHDTLTLCCTNHRSTQHQRERRSNTHRFPYWPYVPRLRVSCRVFIPTMRSTTACA